MNINQRLSEKKFGAETTEFPSVSGSVKFMRDSLAEGLINRTAFGDRCMRNSPGRALSSSALLAANAVVIAIPFRRSIKPNHLLMINLYFVLKLR